VVARLSRLGHAEAVAREDLSLVNDPERHEVVRVVPGSPGSDSSLLGDLGVAEPPRRTQECSVDLDLVSADLVGFHAPDHTSPCQVTPDYDTAASRSAFLRARQSLEA
jgi:hypothetical protein